MHNKDDKSKRRLSVSNIYVENRGFLEDFIRKFLPNRQDVEDVAQEAFLRAYVAEQQKSIEQPKSYLFTAAKHIALNKLTKKSDQITSYLGDMSESVNSSPVASAFAEADGEQQFSLYCSAVVGLDGKTREAYLLRKVHGLSHKEIAKKMNLSISSIEKYLRQAALDVNKYIRDARGTVTQSELPRKLRRDGV